MSIKSKVERLEQKLIPKNPGVIVCHSKKEVEYKVKAYFAENPNAPRPLVIIAKRIDKEADL